MKKKNVNIALFIIMMGAMLLILTGCGNKQEENTNTNELTDTNNTIETNIISENSTKIIGEWKAIGTNNDSYSLGELYGTAFSYANELILNEDGTYKLAIGVTYWQEGKYEIDGDTIKLINTEYKGDNPDNKIAEKLTIKDNQIILEEKQSDNTTVNILFKNVEDIDNNEDNEISNTATSTSTNESTINNSGELTIGSHTIKYGTYNGIDAATGDVLVINSDKTAKLNGTDYAYTVGTFNFAQDISYDAYEDAIIFQNSKGETAFALYVGNDGNLWSDPMCYVYSGN